MVGTVAVRNELSNHREQLEEDVGIRMKEIWIEILEKKYGTLSRPNFSFVFDVMAEDPYRHLVGDICKHFLKKDETEENYDVSFGYVLSLASGFQCLLRISMVAPYALLMRIHEDGSLSPPVIEEKTSSPTELAVMEIVRSHGVSLLDENALKTVVPSSGKTSKSLYEWLFVDESEIPWK